MQQQAGIRSIALGGRPNRNLIQAVGGVKGTNDYPYSYILSGVELPFQIHHYHTEAYYNTTVLGTYSDLPLYRATNYVVNARDGIRQGDETETTLQFVYEAADCRIFYTPQMVVEQAAVWRAAADTAFRGINHCVAGDLNQSLSARREMAERKRELRRGVDVAEHYRSLSEVWTGKGGVTGGGDAYMFP